jgi:hypothetical protein
MSDRQGENHGRATLTDSQVSLIKFSATWLELCAARRAIRRWPPCDQRHQFRKNLGAHPIVPTNSRRIFTNPTTTQTNHAWDQTRVQPRRTE